MVSFFTVHLLFADGRETLYILLLGFSVFRLSPKGLNPVAVTSTREEKAVELELLNIFFLMCILM